MIPHFSSVGEAAIQGSGRSESIVILVVGSKDRCSRHRWRWRLCFGFERDPSGAVLILVYSGREVAGPPVRPSLGARGDKRLTTVLNG